MRFKELVAVFATYHKSFYLWHGSCQHLATCQPSSMVLHVSSEYYRYPCESIQEMTRRSCAQSRDMLYTVVNFELNVEKGFIVSLFHIYICSLLVKAGPILHP